MKCYCLEGGFFFFFGGLRVRNSRHGTSSETLCVRKFLFVYRTVHDPRFHCIGELILSVTMSTAVQQSRAGCHS